MLIVSFISVRLLCFFFMGNFNHHARSSAVTHSKEYALSEREFELLVETANELDGYQKNDATFILFLAGRLGMRAGEIAHLEESWVNFRENIISIPAHKQCESGQDGSMCGYCKQEVRQAAEHNGIGYDVVAENWWRPKTEAGVRGVPWDFSPRTQLAIERFFDEFDGYEHSYTSISRRVKSVAEQADEVSVEDVFPHALRATAATYHASRGLETHALTSFMGWANMSTAHAYIARSDENTRRAVRATHSR